ncbi:ABC transporter permease [Bacillus sp. 165]|uniref:ABC transporter permease n=1 Tax=Bacillus sp. 165 TaxID=1529117 RepID=UPI001ADAE25A|nr:ABC transporter permease [Bacillus sp. 165]
MINLTYNELLKVWKQKVFIAPFIILLIPVIILGRWDVVAQQNAKDKTSWKQELMEQNEKHQKELAKGEVPSLMAKQMKDEIKLNEYRLEHNLPPDVQHSLFGFMKSCTNLVTLVSLILITYASSMISKEHQWGTMNFLMVRPALRTEILLSKFAAVIVLYILLCGVLALFSFGEGVLIYGLSMNSYPELKIVNGAIIEQSVAIDIVKSYVYQFLPVLFYATVAFTLSTILKSNGPAIIIAVVITAVSDPIAQVLSQYSWSKFLVFANTDLLMYENGVPLMEGMTLSFSVVMLLGYIGVLLLLSLLVFKRRDFI